VIEILAGFPENVIAFVARGHVSSQDYDEVLIPKVKEALGRHQKVRCYYELGPEFSGMAPGALWQDFKVGIEYLSRWERVAVVTNQDWIRIAMNLFRFLVPGEIRVFGAADAAQARQWIAAE
jgi:hypothetical protein